MVMVMQRWRTWRQECCAVRTSAQHVWRSVEAAGPHLVGTVWTKERRVKAICAISIVGRVVLTVRLVVVAVIVVIVIIPLTSIFIIIVACIGS